MDSLIKRLREAEAGSRELDIAVMREAGLSMSMIGLTVPGYTTSLDAIVALIGEKLPGCEWEVGYDSAAQRYSAATNPIWWFDAPTPALSLCVALLEALQSQEPAPPFIGRGET